MKRIQMTPSGRRILTKQRHRLWRPEKIFKRGKDLMRALEELEEVRIIIINKRVESDSLKPPSDHFSCKLGPIV
jgi:hypothetical protein